MSGTNNLFAQWRAMFTGGPLQAGEVVAYADGVAIIELPGGAILRARGETVIGAHVMVRDGVIQGPALDLPVDSDEV